MSQQTWAQVGHSHTSQSCCSSRILIYGTADGKRSALSHRSSATRADRRQTPPDLRDETTNETRLWVTGHTKLADAAYIRLTLCLWQGLGRRTS